MPLRHLPIIVAAVLAPTIVLGQGATLSGSEIRSQISGKRVYLATPFGGEFPLYYQANGTVDGSGEALGLGRYMRPEDSGKWWITGNQLCQQWTSWYDGKQFCFTLKDGEGDRLYWTRDDGLTGRARIGN
ncbi:hypothetical protein [Amorphus orientalis]|uniref:Uncharacterized protein n=1 Tax=Amorphus orientalis TaxID=649198 RepID=A0AAE3VPG1_9HYPH|nr:hypothetical protein [Amorphus orientalis]MDQ0315872.1 hypothetical protein [Amorphus orientalis]